MDDDGESPEPDPRADLLGEMRALRRQARAARHAYWFPLVLFGLLTCASLPFYVEQTPPAGVAGPGSRLPVLGGSAGFPTQRYLGYYWLGAEVGAVLLALPWGRGEAG